MSRLVVKKAVPDDTKMLRDMSVRSFSTDEVAQRSAGEPPMYDSEKWYREKIYQGIVYKVLLVDVIIGCAILYPDRETTGALNIGRIFIDPPYMNKGYGKSLMHLIEDTFTDYRSFTLDTPVWNMRTNTFYQKLGYKEVSRKHCLVYYRKDRADC